MKLEKAFTYRLSNTLDPEERLEDAAMAKAMHEAFGGELSILPPGRDKADFGRDMLFAGERENIAYWRDPAFISGCGRRFRVCDIQQAEDEVSEIHASGSDAFIKATDIKLFAMKVARGMGIRETIQDYIWSVIDRPDVLMVQEYVPMEWEMRFVSVDRRIVTESPAAIHLTPIHRLHREHLFRTPASRQPRFQSTFAHKMRLLAEVTARQCAKECVIIDTAIVGGEAVLIEFNPFSIGNFGLYHCDPIAIAQAYRKFIQRPAAFGGDMRGE